MELISVQHSVALFRLAQKSESVCHTVELFALSQRPVSSAHKTHIHRCRFSI